MRYKNVIHARGTFEKLCSLTLPDTSPSSAFPVKEVIKMKKRLISMWRSFNPIPRHPRRLIISLQSRKKIWICINLLDEEFQIDRLVREYLGRYPHVMSSVHMTTFYYLNSASSEMDEGEKKMSDEEGTDSKKPRINRVKTIHI